MKKKAMGFKEKIKRGDLGGRRKDKKKKPGS